MNACLCFNWGRLDSEITKYRCSKGNNGNHEIVETALKRADDNAPHDIEAQHDPSYYGRDVPRRASHDNR